MSPSFKPPSRNLMMLSGVAGLTLFAIVIPLVGWNWMSRASRSSTAATEANANASRPVKIAALGRVEPAAGVIKVGGTMGEILEKLTVSEGNWVTKGQIIGYLQSYQERQSELEQAQQQLQTAQARLQAETQFSQSQLQERLIDTEQLPSVRDREIAAQNAQIQGLRAEQTLALKELEQYRLLFEQGATPRLELNQRQAKAEQTTQQVRQAEETLKQLTKDRNLKVDAAQAQLQTAKTNLNRIQANSEVQDAQRSVQRASVRLQNALIRAPQAGRVLRLLTRTGEAIGDDGRGKGTILELADTTSMLVIAEIHESDIRLVQLGQVAQVVSRNQAFADVLTGRVVEIGRQIYKNDRLNDDPSALSDARVVEVKIQMDNSQALASLTYLQVDVSIPLQPTAQSQRPQQVLYSDSQIGKPQLVDELMSGRVDNQQLMTLQALSRG